MLVCVCVCVRVCVRASARVSAPVHWIHWFPWSGLRAWEFGPGLPCGWQECNATLQGIPQQEAGMEPELGLTPSLCAGRQQTWELVCALLGSVSCPSARVCPFCLASCLPPSVSSFADADDIQGSISQEVKPWVCCAPRGDMIYDPSWHHPPPLIPHYSKMVFETGQFDDAED